MLKQIRNRHFLLLDIILLTLAVYASFVLRLERFNIDRFWPGAVLFGCVALVVMVTVFRSMGVYSRFWQYASIDEVLLLVGAGTTGTLIAGAISFLTILFLPVNWVLPRSIPLIFLLLSLAAIAGPRLAFRTLALYSRRGHSASPTKRVLIMGAGDAGEMMGREMMKALHLGLLPVGFVDDDLNKHGMRIHGIPVLGGREEIPRLAAQYEVDQVLIAIPSASGKTIREIVQLCELAQVQTKTVPGIHEILQGTVSVNQIRDVNIEDLLRREAVRTDTTAVRNLLQGKRVLITGAGGSIGSELCRQVLQCRPATMILAGHGENSIFSIYHELTQIAGEVKLTPVIVDVRFSRRVHHLFEQYRPDVVLHAAAHKHVPLMEMNPSEAITNNVSGTQNLLAAAQSVAVSHFVMISTDKAVNPTSIMGASKRAAELLVHQAAHATGKPYVAVRFGNVLGSRGSVVLTFKRQIAKGGPVTVTHPEMKRFFMTIPEAVQLVLQAATIGQGGEVFVLDMGQPIKIVDLARDLIELSGLGVGRDIDIEFVGMRPGEKLFEEMFVPGEQYQRTPHDKIFIAANASKFVPDDLGGSIGVLLGASERDDIVGIYRALQNLIPEFEPVRETVVGSGKQAAPPRLDSQKPVAAYANQ